MGCANKLERMKYLLPRNACKPRSESRFTDFFVILFNTFFMGGSIGHIATVFPVRVLYPEPRTQPYEIPIYCHSSTAQSILLPVGSGLQDSQWLWVRPGLLDNLFGVRPIPTGYCLYTLNPPLLGFEPIGPYNRP